jgi:hypothetical protein
MMSRKRDETERRQKKKEKKERRPEKYQQVKVSNEERWSPSESKQGSRDDKYLLRYGKGDTAVE